MKAILGKKLGMTTVYDKELGAQNITLLECPENAVFSLREQDKDGYEAAVLSVSLGGKKSIRREIRLSPEDEKPSSGEKITVEVFSPGQKVKVTGLTKAKGFQGVVKRHGFAGGPKTHGHRHVLRQAGSIGSAFPQHVRKGKKMAGRMGGEKFTVSGLQVVLVDKEKNLIGVRGAVPGVAGRLVIVRAQN
ncbi:MAG TPA: 50S ribosomal protein L3 [Candidatus Moranbacteria bacterium]|nr:50S ribosomal protein L3 [Candidatus Moranbacteria bacterium]